MWEEIAFSDVAGWAGQTEVVFGIGAARVFFLTRGGKGRSNFFIMAEMGHEWVGKRQRGRAGFFPTIRFEACGTAYRRMGRREIVRVYSAHKISQLLARAKVYSGPDSLYGLPGLRGSMGARY